jgi:chromosome segregation ATPase
VSDKSKDLVGIEANSVSNNNSSIVTTIFEIDRKYQEQIADFMNQLHSLNSEIESITKELELLQENIKDNEKELKSISNNVNSDLLYIEKLNDKLVNKIYIAIEMKKVDSFNSSYQSIVDELNEDIRELEIDILQKELQKENLQLKLMPSWQKITELKQKLNKLTTKKRYIESLGLQKNSNNTQEKQLSNEVVDVDAQ